MGVEVEAKGARNGCVVSQGCRCCGQKKCRDECCNLVCHVKSLVVS